MENTSNTKTLITEALHGVLNSYSQVFFSNHLWFSILLLIVSFFDFNTGLCGLMGILVSNLSAYLVGLNRFNIRAGYYGFNSLMVGMAVGVYYQPGLELFVVVIFASILTLILTVVSEGVIGKYGLPFMSAAFLLVIWFVSLAARQFKTLEISERGVYLLNELYSTGGLSSIKLYNWFYSLPIDKSILIYLRSMGAIFFQYNIFAGIIITIGLLLYSRIAFLLSLIGFFSAYLFYYFIGGNIAELSYGYIGFNFILTAIAIGGFFLVSSKYSFLWVILLTPIISILITSINSIFLMYQLPIYSLPFNVIVLAFLYMLKFRERSFSKPEIVYFQQFSPEKNLYSQLNQKARFGHYKYIPFSLPFFDEWKITQGRNGKFTHKGEWKHALDFEIEDDKKSLYKVNGIAKEDYLCYNKPVLAPADGWVEEVVNYIDDNNIGDVNLQQNWGNTIIIKHVDFLYSKLNHLKKESIKVVKGEYVKKGDIIAYCGNSGRSPQPHLHLQFQSTPYIDSKTMDYPLGHYIVRNENKYLLKSFETPKEGEMVSNIVIKQSLYEAFRFVPGQKINLLMTKNGNKSQEIVWEVFADYYNNTYIYDEKSGAKAFFTNDGKIHQFTHFEGSKKSALFYFFLGSYKFLMSFYNNMEIKDTYSLSIFNYSFLKIIQDFISPFYIFIHAEYSHKHLKFFDYFGDCKASFNSKATKRIWGKTLREINFDIIIDNQKINKFIVKEKNETIEIIFL